MELKIRHSLFVKIVNGEKKSTSRLGERDVKIGETLIFTSDKEGQSYETTVDSVKICKFAEITVPCQFRMLFQNNLPVVA